jgi:ABC-type uncharacterized transport system involved in gliding motility auxiliary subunit
VAGAVALFVALVAMNAIAAALHLRVDLTEERLYTLSEGTRSFLRALPRPAQLKFYATRGEAMPIPLRQYARRVESLLREYVRLSGGRLTLEVYDPRPDSDEEEWARKYGIEGRPLDFFGEGPAVFLGLAAVSGAREAAIPFLSPEDEPRLEYEITRLLHEVTRPQKPRVGLLSSLDLLGGMRSPVGGRPTPGWMFARELQALYEVVNISPTDDRLPENLEALVIVHPRELNETLLYAVDQYVVGGGHLLAFVDPFCLAEVESLGPMGSPFGFSGARSDVNRLSETWGFVMNPKLVADPAMATLVRAGDSPPMLNPAWLTLREEALERGEIATSGLNLLMLPFAGAFAGTAAPGLTMTPLLRASTSAGFADPMAAAMGGDLLRDLQPDPTARLLAFRLAGRFRSAFPGGPPSKKEQKGQDPSEPPIEAPAGETSGENVQSDTRSEAADESKTEGGDSAHLAEGTFTGVVVLVADVDLLYDRFAIERRPFLGYEVAQLANDNLNFAWNLVEQLAGSDVLISLRSRGKFERPFHRVEEIERRALEQWRAEEQRLMEQLQQTRERLEQLRSMGDPNPQVIITEEQRREIERFRQQQFETERQLKEVRKRRRSEIERLGWIIKTVNLAAIPLAVALFGIVRGVARRRKSGA